MNLSRLLLLAVVTNVSVMAAQDFDVASIKFNNRASAGSSMETGPGRLTARSLSVRSLILYAYDLQDFRLTGGPDWLRTDRYDIEAKTEAAASESVVPAMLRALLADRFQLKVHGEKRELPIYELVIAKNGPKLTKGTIPTVGAGGGIRGINGGGGQLTVRNGPITSLIQSLSGSLGRTVVDRTGLTGNFDFILKWESASRPSGVNPGDVATDPGASSIFTAVQEQLGLRLESTKAPVDILIIDSVQRPSEN